jgi:hypothetical protein
MNDFLFQQKVRLRDSYDRMLLGTSMVDAAKLFVDQDHENLASRGVFANVLRQALESALNLWSATNNGKIPDRDTPAEISNATATAFIHASFARHAGLIRNLACVRDQLSELFNIDLLLLSEKN